MSIVRVVTLNIWNRLGPWEERLSVIRDGLRALSPDLVGLQEVIDVSGVSQASAIAEGLGFHTAYGEANSYGGGVTLGNAVLSKWEIAQQVVMPLPHVETDERRSALYAAIRSPFGQIPFFVTHLNWKLHEGFVREKQVVAVAAFVKEHAPIDGLPPILTGDFNAAPESAEVRFLKGLQSLEGKSVYLADCYEQTGQGIGVTFDGTRNTFAAQYNEYPRRIDYVFVRGPDKDGRGKPRFSKVVFDEAQNGIFATDHFGVLADITM